MKLILGVACLFVAVHAATLSDKSKVKIEKVIKPMFLGEGPHWEPKSQKLFLVNLKEGEIVRYDPATGTTISQKLSSQEVSFIIPVKNKPDHFVIGDRLNITLVHWDTKNNKIVSREVLETVPEPATNRLNDAKCDVTGRLWLGTMANDLTPEQGFLYSYTKKEGLRKHLDKISISNGIGFSTGNDKMYYIDSSKKTVEQYKFDAVTGKISDFKLLFDFVKHNMNALPDGMTVDAEGSLWVAVNGANRVVNIDPEGNLLQTIIFPLSHELTSLTFGGKNLDGLYVTSAAERMTSEDHVKFPEAGTTYRVTGLGVNGLLPNEFDLDA